MLLRSNHALQRFEGLGKARRRIRGCEGIARGDTETAGAGESTVPAAGAVSSSRTAGLSSRSVPPSLSLGR